MDSKQISFSQSLYFKGFQSPVPSLSQGILFIKIVMFVTLYAEKPPSTGITVPVTNPLALSSASHIRVPIRSEISPNFFMGVAARILPVLAVGVPSSLNKRLLFWLVTKKPGAIALQRILQGAKCTASHCVKFEIPAFAARLRSPILQFSQERYIPSCVRFSK